MMARDFTHTITVPTSRSAYPLTATVTATFDNDGSIDRWALSIRDLSPLSVKTRDALHYALKGVSRAEIMNDGIGAKWETANRLAIWTASYHWALTVKQAIIFRNEIDMAIGRFAKAAKPAPEPYPWEVKAEPTPAPAPSPSETLRPIAGAPVGANIPPFPGSRP